MLGANFLGDKNRLGLVYGPAGGLTELFAKSFNLSGSRQRD